jgi:hypothetical protein
MADSGGFPMGPSRSEPEPAPAGGAFGFNDQPMIDEQPAYYPPMNAPAPGYAPPPSYPPAGYGQPPAYPPPGYGTPPGYGAPPGYAPPPGYGPPPSPGPAGFDNIDASLDGETMVARPRGRTGGKGKRNNGMLIGWLVVGGLFLVTVGVLAAVLPGVLRSVNEDPQKGHAQVDPKKKRPNDPLKKPIDVNGKEKGKDAGLVKAAPIVPTGPGIMPRRMLYISPEDYLLLNRTQFFQEDNKAGQYENTLVRKFSAGAPLDLSPTQVYVLSDTDILQSAMPPQKSLVAGAGSHHDLLVRARGGDRGEDLPDPDRRGQGHEGDVHPARLGLRTARQVEGPAKGPHLRRLPVSAGERPGAAQHRCDDRGGRQGARGAAGRHPGVDGVREGPAVDRVRVGERLPAGDAANSR